MKMSLRKQMLAETVQLLTQKIIYVRRVRPKAIGLPSWRNSGGSGGHRNSGADGVSTELVRGPSVRVVWCSILAAIGLNMTTILAHAQAEHEVDHRFIIEGYVCGEDGKPMANQEVMVKDTRIPL